MMSPCYKCKDRTINCHGECVKYTNFRNKLDKVNETKKDEYKEYIQDAMERMKTVRI